MPPFNSMLQNAFVAAPPALTVLAGAIGLNLLLRRALRLLAAKTCFANGELLPVPRGVSLHALRFL
jgi:hypothetical protein